MDQSLCRFNLSHLVVRDLKETQIKKGKNILIVASLNDEKVVLRKVKAPNSISTQEDELNYFYYIVNISIATCLGFALFESNYYLVFDYAMFTVEDWVNQVNLFCADNQDNRTKKLEHKIKVFYDLVKIILEFRYRGFYFEQIELSEIFIDEFLNVKIFDLSQFRQGCCSDDKFETVCNYLGEKIFGKEYRKLRHDELIQNIPRERLED